MAKGDRKIIIGMIKIDYKYGEIILENYPGRGKYVSKQKTNYGVIIVDNSTNEIYFKRLLNGEDFVAKDFAKECHRFGIFSEEELFEIIL